MPPSQPPTARTLSRCTWPGLAGNDLYEHYHDTEWGVPTADDRKLFEKLILEGFQAGLSWLTILRKRDTFRRAFHGFDPEIMAQMTDRDLAALMNDPGIVRNRLKIEASRDSARACLKLQERQSLATFLWDHLDGQPIINRYGAHGDVPAQTDLSKRLSKALIGEGFRFVGPTTVYAFLQSMGFVNDHLVTCHRHAACAKLQRAFLPPTR
jgi:DNA-3-methyladenine glycosylase I